MKAHDTQKGQAPIKTMEDFFIEIEAYKSPYAEAIGDTGEIIFPLIRKASLKAAALSAGIGILPGKFSLLGIVPEVFFLLKLQSRLVKDIAIILGKENYLTRNVLLYCLFKENKPDMVQAFIRMTSTRILIKPSSIEAVYSLFLMLLRKKSEQFAKSKNKYLIKIFSSLSAGSLSYIDTQLVGMTANSLFLSEIQFEVSSKNN